MPPSRRRLLVHAWLVLTLAGVVRCLANVVLAGRTDARVVATPRRVDLNRASLAELQTLPGIGPERARAIILHRVRHGPFAARQALAEVDGLGPVTVASVAEYLVPLPEDPPQEAPVPASSR